MKYFTLVFFLLSSLFILAGCTSVPKLVEQGRLEKAYAIAAEHCTRVRAHKNERYRTLKPERLRDLQIAYTAIQQRDLKRVNELEAGNEPATWPGRHRLYVALHGRSLEYAALAPDDRLLTLVLRPSRLGEQRETARLAAGQYYLDQAAPHLTAARRGLKGPARDAYYDVDAAIDYLPEQASRLGPLLDTLRENGTLRIWLYVPGDEGYNQTLHAVASRMPDDYQDWTEITTQPLGETRVDLEAELTCTSTASTGLRYSNSTSHYSAEVLDYVEKKKEKVKVNDSTWVEKIIEIEHFKTVRATITTHEESLRVDAYGRVSVFLPGEDEALWEEKLHNSANWSDAYVTCSGDRRALPGCSCPGRTIIHRPSEHSLLLKAVGGMPGMARGAVRRRYGVPAVR